MTFTLGIFLAVGGRATSASMRARAGEAAGWTVSAAPHRRASVRVIMVIEPFGRSFPDVFALASTATESLSLSRLRQAIDLQLTRSSRKKTLPPAPVPLAWR